MSEMQRWEGKIAVVTGASAGIGVAIAEKLVESGLQVVGLARRKERLDELEKKLTGQKGKFIPHVVDMSNKENILEAFKWIKQNVGPISILVNNAGLANNSPIVAGNIDAWKTVIDTNFFGLVVASKQAVESMQENQIDGHIVNINSVAGHEVLNFPNQNVYPASKYAVTAFTKSLRKELALSKSKIRITSVSPGLVATEIFDASGFHTTPELMSQIEISPQLQSEDVANAVLYVVGSPSHVQITELTIQPTGEMF